MQNTSKFSVSQAINYAFKTYFKNLTFFLSVFALASIPIALFYYLQMLVPAKFSAIFVIIKFIAQFLGIMALDILIIKNYDNSKPFSFKDLFNNNFNFIAYLIYFLLLYTIESLPALTIASLTSSSQISILIGSIIAGVISLYFTFDYILGKYLILDKGLTFGQSFRMAPHLVHGEKMRIFFTWFICALIISLPYLIIFLGLYVGLGYKELAYTPIVTAPFIIAYSSPLYALINVSIYKQLIGNADNDFKEAIASYKFDNTNEEMDEIL